MAIRDEIGASVRQQAEGRGTLVVGLGQRWGAGTGIVLSEGRVLTNAHNVRGDRVTVTFADGRTAEGGVAGHDVDGDLALINIDSGGVAPPPLGPRPPPRHPGGGVSPAHTRGGRRPGGLLVPPPHPRALF